MYEENPGTDMFKKDVYILETSDSAAGMRKALPKLAKFAAKLAKGEEILSPKEEGYHQRGLRVNFFSETRGSERAVEMLVKKLKVKNSKQNIQCLTLTELNQIQLLKT